MLASLTQVPCSSNPIRHPILGESSYASTLICSHLVLLHGFKFSRDKLQLRKDKCLKLSWRWVSSGNLFRWVGRTGTSSANTDSTKSHSIKIQMMFKFLIEHFPYWNRQVVIWRFTAETELSFALRAMLQSSFFSIKNSVVSHSEGEIKKNL